MNVSYQILSEAVDVVQVVDEVKVVVVVDVDKVTVRVVKKKRASAEPILCCWLAS